MKGQFDPFSFFLAALILTGAFLITILIPRYTIIRLVDLQYRLDSTQSTLLALLSVTDQNKIPLIEIIGENSLLTNGPNLQSVVNTLDKYIFTDKCYSLSNSSSMLISPQSGCNPQFPAYAKIPLPYNPTKLVDTLKLVRN